jgi:hypothetical protein
MMWGGCGCSARLSIFDQAPPAGQQAMLGGPTLDSVCIGSSNFNARTSKYPNLVILMIGYHR